MPASRFVADFIGDVNLMQGRVSAVEAQGIAIESAAVGGTIRVDSRRGAGATFMISLPIALANGHDPGARVNNG